MKRPLSTVALFFALATPCSVYSADPPAPPAALYLKVPAAVKGDPGAFVQIPADTNGATVSWVSVDPGLNLFPVTLLKDTKTAVVSSTIPGTYRVFAVTAKADAPSDFAVCVVTIGVPVPPGPIPPGPTPPGPTPGPAPIPADGLHVLIVEDSTQRTALPAAQSNVLFAKSIRDYLNAKAPTGPDGKTHEWRIWDKDVDASSESKLWQDALKRPHASLPWIIISNGKAGFEGPLPANVADTLTLLKKYGGE